MKEKQITISTEELKQRLSPAENIFGMITRVELAKRSGGLFNRKTMANWDSQKKGFEQKLVNEENQQVAYFIEDVLRYIRDNYRVVTKTK